jgi:hypothetical protein
MELILQKLLLFVNIFHILHILDENVKPHFEFIDVIERSVVSGSPVNKSVEVESIDLKARELVGDCVKNGSIHIKEGGGWVLWRGIADVDIATHSGCE